ncbi:DUF2000 family protein [Leisingera sp. ANG59]|uniref:DUF2000 family protein n=1 Tax=Leisingera sp. ANG59 TaxID=2675221 RepID=UPI001573C5BB|nr:DUF2000 family protein [Leisingera sp. ANG59]NSY38315.1 DUF2000 family protein [Leisingera sp. ANG59]
MFDTKIAIVVREDLAAWQKLNVTAFLATGLAGASPDLIGEPYLDRDGNRYAPLAIQPMIVLAADAGKLKTIHGRALSRGAEVALYTEEMFATGHDAANRAVVAEYSAADLNIVGLALRAERKAADKITKGARMHP